MIQTRISRLRQNLDSDSSLLVSNPVNIRYLSGFSGSNGLLLVSMDSVFLITDSRYKIQSQQECSELDTVIGRDLYESALNLLNTKNLAIEGQSLTVDNWQRLQSKVANLIASGPIVEELRIVKDPNEIALIKTACEISTNALAHVQDKIEIGMSERQIARLLEAAMFDFGAQAIAFPTIVATGANSAIPHHQPTDRPLAKGDLLKIDFGARFDGYHADCTRTFVAGKPDNWQRDLHEKVLASQQAGVKALVAGVDFQRVVEASNAPLEDAGMLDKFTHGLGHGVGLEIHEQPFLSSANGGKIAERTIVTIEPGVYLPNVGGIRIEDTVVVTSLASEVLTKFTYELTSVG